MDNNEQAGRAGAFAKQHWKPIAGALGLLLAVAYSGGWFGEKVKPGTLAGEAGSEVPAGALTATVLRTNAAARLSLFGTTASDVKVNLSARIPATVSEVFVSAGDAVKKDQLLVTLDDREIKEQLAAAEAQAKQAETEFQRARQLFEKAATTEQALTAAGSMRSAAKAQLDRVQVMLSYARIVSPIDGVVTDRRIEAGDLAGPGQVLLAVYDPARMRLEVPVPVRLVEHVAMGQEVQIVLDRPSRAYRGKVTEIVSEIDPASRTQTVKARLDGTAGDVLPGTFGRLSVDGEPRETLLIPAGAVYRVGQLEMVQVVAGGRASRRMVTTGAVYGDRVEVLSGLNAGEQVLATPLMKGA